LSKLGRYAQARGSGLLSHASVDNDLINSIVVPTFEVVNENLIFYDFEAQLPSVRGLVSDRIAVKLDVRRFAGLESSELCLARSEKVGDGAARISSWWRWGFQVPGLSRCHRVERRGLLCP